MTSQGIYLHHSNPIVLKIPCAKFHASSCSQTKLKVGGGEFCPPTQKRGSKTLQKGLEMQNITQPAFTCSKLTIETLEQGVKYVQS